MTLFLDEIMQVLNSISCIFDGKSGIVGRDVILYLLFIWGIIFRHFYFVYSFILFNFFSFLLFLFLYIIYFLMLFEKLNSLRYLHDIYHIFIKFVYFYLVFFSQSKKYRKVYLMKFYLFLVNSFFMLLFTGNFQKKNFLHLIT